MTGYPLIKLPGSDGWIDAYTLGEELEKVFPGQDVCNLCYAIDIHRSKGLTFDDLNNMSELKMLQRGCNDGPSWIWEIKLRDGRQLEVTGWCDYTGWDCQSELDVKVATPSAVDVWYNVCRNSDLTEGKGVRIVVESVLSLKEALARIKGIDVQGTDGQVYRAELLRNDLGIPSIKETSIYNSWNKFRVSDMTDEEIAEVGPALENPEVLKYISKLEDLGYKVVKELR